MKKDIPDLQPYPDLVCPIGKMGTLIGRLARLWGAFFHSRIATEVEEREFWKEKNHDNHGLMNVRSRSWMDAIASKSFASR